MALTSCSDKDGNETSPGDSTIGQLADVTIIYYGCGGGNLQALESGHGYMYYSTDATAKSFVYPDAPSASARKAAPRRAPEALHIFTPIKLTQKPTQPGVYIHRGQRVSIGIAH